MADGSLIFDTKLDSDGLKKGLSGVGGLAGGTFKAAAVGVGAISAATVAAGGAIAGLTTQSIQAYAEYEQLTGGVETLFGSSASIVEGYAKTAYKTAGMSANAYMDTVTSFSASLLQSLGGDTEAAAQKADQAVTDMADNANKMGTSTEMIQNAYQGFAKQNFTMLDNLKLGYGGTKEEMQRLLDDATKLSGVQYDISSYADIVDAIHVVQTEMGITGTTAKEASSTISGSIDSMKGAYTNFVAGMADDNADYDELLSNLMDSITTVVGNVAPRIIEAVPNIVSGFGELFNEIGGYLPDLMAQLAPPVLAGISSVFGSLLDYAPIILDFALSVITQLGSALIDNMPVLLDAAHQIADTILTGIGDAVPIINPVTDALKFMIDNLNTILAIVIPLTAAFVAYKAVMLVSQGVTAAMTIAQYALNLAMSLNPIGIIIALIAALVAGFIYLWNTSEGFRNFWIGLWKSITDTIALAKLGFDTVINAIVNFFTKTIPDALMSFLVKALQFIQWWQDLPNKIIGSISDLPSKMMDIGGNLIAGLWQGISDKVAWLKDKISGFGADVLDTIKGIFGIHSPSRKFAWIGKMCVEGFEQPLEDYNPYDTLSASMKANKTTMQMNYVAGMSVNAQSQNLINYDRLGESVVNAFVSSGTGVMIGDREAGRWVRGVMAT